MCPTRAVSGTDIAHVATELRERGRGSTPLSCYADRAVLLRRSCYPATPIVLSCQAYPCILLRLSCCPAAPIVLSSYAYRAIVISRSCYLATPVV
eukprot:3899757-Rhodomonas_salina.4